MSGHGGHRPRVANLTRDSHFTLRESEGDDTCTHEPVFIGCSIVDRSPSTSSSISWALNSTPGLQLGLLVYPVHSTLSEESACSSSLLAFALSGAFLGSGFLLVIMDSCYPRADVDLDIPAIAVMGWQSAGKSSLIEAISGITLPRASGTCTR
jgi:hypothetical protein